MSVKCGDAPPELGSFDELITPFLMDSGENFEFDEHGTTSGVPEATQMMSFDGLGVEDLGLFTQSNLEAMSEHSLAGPLALGLSASGLSASQLAPLAEGSFSLHKRRRLADPFSSLTSELVASTTIVPPQEAINAPSPLVEEEEDDAKGKKRGRKRRAKEQQQQQQRAPAPPAVDRAARQREQTQSAQRRKKMYVDYLKQHVGGALDEPDLPTAPTVVCESSSSSSSQPRRSSRRARDDDDADHQNRLNGLPQDDGDGGRAPPLGTRSSSRRKRSAKDDALERSPQRRRRQTHQHKGDSRTEDWGVDTEPDAHDASLQRAIALQFLKYRTSSVLDPDCWRDIVDDNFELVLPREPYRVNYGTPADRNTHRIAGVDNIIRDTRSMGALVEMIRARCWRIKQLDLRARLAVRNAQAKPLGKAEADASHLPGGDAAVAVATAVNGGRTEDLPNGHVEDTSDVANTQQQSSEEQRRRQLAALSENAPRAAAFAKIGVRYVADAHEILVADRLLMCSWTFETVGLVEVGFTSEVAVDGMLKAVFTEGGTRKLEKATLSFDCMAFMQQLNAHGLLDMAAIAAAASSVSRGVATPTAARPAADTPRRNAAPTALNNNPTTLSNLASASPNLISSLAAATQAVGPEAAARARQLLANLQAAQQAAAAAAAGGVTSAGQQPPSVRRRSDSNDAPAPAASTAPSQTTAQPATPLNINASTAAKFPASEVSTEFARNAVAGQYLRALAAASKSGTAAGVGAVLGDSNATSNNNKTNNSTPVTAAASMVQKQRQQQQQMLMQCMPYLANYSWNMALLRQQQQKAASATGTQQQQSASTASQQQAQQPTQPQQQLNVQQMQQQAQQLQQQLLQQQIAQQQQQQQQNQQQQQQQQGQHGHLSHHKQLSPQHQRQQQLAHQQLSPFVVQSQPQQQQLQQLAQQLSAAQSHGQPHATASSQQQSTLRTQEQQRHEDEEKASPTTLREAAHSVCADHSVSTLGPVPEPMSAGHRSQSAPLPSTTGANSTAQLQSLRGQYASADAMAAAPAVTSSQPSSAVTVGNSVLGTGSATKPGGTVAPGVASGAGNSVVANAMLAKYMSLANSAPMMQMMANYMANVVNQRQQQAKQAAAATKQVQTQQHRR